MTWTTTTPTGEGWYWWRKDGLVLVVELVRNVMGNLIEEDGDLTKDDFVDAEWSSEPAPMPEEG